MKGYLTEYDFIALLGCHNTGVANQMNSGFSGPWGQRTDRNIITTNVYKFLMGYQGGSGFSLTQTQSALNPTSGGMGESLHFSEPPPYSRYQWTSNLNTRASQMRLNIDMGYYHNFTGNAEGATSGKYCPQLSNITLYDCSKVDPSYMPLSNNAQQVFNYVKNSTLFYSDLINAMLKMISVPS